MPRMMQELDQHPELGFISGHFWFGRTTIAVQYWKSFEALTRYAKQPDLAHLPAWAQFRRNIGNSGDVGIWHETYRVRAGEYEAIYSGMPLRGLARAGQSAAVTAGQESARQRIGTAA